MKLPHRAEYGGGDFNLHMLRFFEFVFVVILGMAAGVVLDFFKCLAHQYQPDGLAIDWDTFPVFAFGISVSIGILGLVLLGQEKIIDFNQETLTIKGSPFKAARALFYGRFPLSFGKTWVLLEIFTK